MLKDYGFSKSENAIMSMHLNYQEKDDISVIKQLAENIALIEVVLKDKEHLSENLDELTTRVHQSKIFGAAVLFMHGDMDLDQDGMLKKSEIEEIKEVMSSIAKDNSDSIEPHM